MLAAPFTMVITGCLIVFSAHTTLADGGERMLYDFAEEDSAEAWQSVNDGVMGGVSDGRFKITEKKSLLFFGTLSLENNGGFASVRSRDTKLSLKEGDAILIRVRGDGREYSLNLYVPRRLTAFSYRYNFTTKKDQWMEVAVPLARFQATSFGRPVRDAEPVDPDEVNSIGFLLGDKKPGPFKVEVAWIKALPSERLVKKQASD